MGHLKAQEGTTRQIKIIMNNLAKLISKIGLISLLSVLPLAAQVGNGVKFTTPFPFYVGDTVMPSGSYTLTQPDDLNFQIAIIRGADGKHNAAFGVVVTGRGAHDRLITANIIQEFYKTMTVTY